MQNVLQRAPLPAVANGADVTKVRIKPEHLTPCPLGRLRRSARGHYAMCVSCAVNECDPISARR